MYPHMAKTVFELTDDGYEANARRARALISARERNLPPSEFS